MSHAMVAQSCGSVSLSSISTIFTAFVHESTTASLLQMLTVIKIISNEILQNDSTWRISVQFIIRLLKIEFPTLLQGLPGFFSWSEMNRLLNAFLSKESIPETLPLSMYSTSGLLKDSQLDTVSSIDTEWSSDLAGVKVTTVLLLHWLRTAGTTSPILQNDAFLLCTTPLDFELKNRDKVCAADLVPLEGEDDFFVFVTFASFCSYTTRRREYVIKRNPNSNLHGRITDAG